jgi:hypothetical protein
MPSVESRLAHRRHQRLLEIIAQDAADRAELHDLRSDMDAKQKDKLAKVARGGEIDGREQYDFDNAYSHQRAAAVQKAMARHRGKSEEKDTRYLADLEAIRRAGPSAGKHPVKTRPERGDPHFEIWRNLDAARASALIGVHERYARAHDDADAAHFDLNKSNMVREDITAQRSVRKRYGGAGSPIGNAIADRLEETHFKLYQQEYAELCDKVRQFERELSDAQARLQRQTEEMHALAARHSGENSMPMRR